jgi:adenosylcobinamide-GDP ribazoletransferase
MRKILLAFQFLTIIPLGNIRDVSEREMGSASVFFPVVGFAQGLMYITFSAIFLRLLPFELVNGLLIIMIILINGGLHLDGLADTFDAIALRGNREEKLAVMKDSAVGSIGVSAIVITILLKYVSLNILFSNSSRLTYYVSLLMMPVFSRWVMVPTSFHAKSARQEGLGRIFIENTGLKELTVSISLVILLVILTGLILNKIDSNYQLSNVVLYLSFILLLLYVFSLLTIWLSNRIFNGMTGDTLGAVSEISEILFLIMTIIITKNII